MSDPGYTRWLEGQLKEVGRRVLDLQAQTTRAYHSARRFETIAALVGDIAADLELDPNVNLEQTFVDRVFDQLYIDVVVLYGGAGVGQLRPLAWAGQSPRSVRLQAAPEAFAFAASNATPDAFTQQLIDATGYRFLLWAWDPEARVGLLLGKDLETRDFYDRFSSEDAPIVRSALRIYLDTRRRLRAEAALRSRLEQSRTLNHISSKFIHVSPETFDSAVLEALDAFTTLLRAERGGIYNVINDGDAIALRYLHTQDGGRLARPDERVGIGATGSLLSILRLQEIVRFEEGHPLARPFLPGTSTCHATLFIPLVFGQGLEGFLYFASVTDCSPADVPDVAFMKTAASSFATALAAERERRTHEALQRQIQQAQKLDSLGVLAGGIAHDFNNILTPILSGLELVRFSASPSAGPLIDSTLDAVERARSLVKQILLFSRKNTVRRQPGDVAGVIREAAELLRASLPATIAMTIELEAMAHGEALTVMGDAHKLEQVLVNLGTNAWHAMDGGKGRLVLRAGRVLDAPQIGGEAVQIQVVDTGPGIPAEIQGSVFDPFFTTKPAGKGTGMGLAVAHGIVADHGGHIAFETGTSGTTFNVWLPGARAEVPRVSSAAPEIPRGSEQVLIVDDEPLIGARIEDMLRHLGYRARSFTRPEDALEALAFAPEAWHLLLTDFTMPDMTGLELARAAAERAPSLAILLCTGYHEPLSPEALTSARIHGVVHKPFRFDELARRVRDALDAR